MSSTAYPRLSPIIVGLIAAVIAAVAAVLVDGALARGVLTGIGVFLVLMTVQVTRRHRAEATRR
jgi:hypothetical protein